MPEALLYLLAGFVVVMTTLVVLCIICILTGYIVRNMEKIRSNVAPPAPAPESSASAPEPSTSQIICAEDVPTHHLTAIFATIATVVGAEARIRKISFASQNAGSTNWSAEGRRAHFSSHQVR